MTNKQALFWSLLWGLLFLLSMPFIYNHYGLIGSTQYFACYITEKLLSLDNLLMFYVIFKYFKVDAKNQARYLTIGLISSFIIRLVFIFGGTWLINMFHWVNYLFSIFLMFTAYKLYFGNDGEEGNPDKTVKIIKKIFPFLTTAGVIIATIEITDVLFAIDSIPASFGITSNPVIIYFANIFAILGLRSLYFVAINFIERITWIDKAAAVILAIIGIEMFIKN